MSAFKTIAMLGPPKQKQNNNSFKSQAQLMMPLLVGWHLLSSFRGFMSHDLELL